MFVCRGNIIGKDISVNVRSNRYAYTVANKVGICEQTQALVICNKRSNC